MSGASGKCRVQDEGPQDAGGFPGFETDRPQALLYSGQDDVRQ
jgi:hypothetical protein